MCGAIYRNELAHCPNDGGELRLMTADPLVGKTIDNHYVIDALIGEGAMGRVYRAHHSRLLHKRYAIKVLLGDLAATAQMRMRFQNEAEAASRLDHPNIVGVVDFGRTRAGLLYLVMELVEGPSLRRVLRDAALSPARVAALGKQIALGLAHAHARGVVHRDLKPDNVLLVGDTPMLADFGLAISVVGDDARLTTSGVMCTPLYAAPEQMLGKDIDHRVDLYALGATLFELVAARPVFEGDANQVAAKKLATKAPKIASVAPHVPRALAAVIDRLLERKPAARYQTATEVAGALDAAIAPRKWFRLRLRSAAAGVAAIAIAGAGLSGMRGGPRASGLGPPVIEKSSAVPVSPPATQIVEASTADVISPEARGPKPEAPSPEARGPRPEAPSASRHVARVSTLASRRTAARSAPKLKLLTVHGPVSPQAIQRGLDRVAPMVASCADQMGARGASATFSIGETKRATSLRVEGTGARCLEGALAKVRIEEGATSGDTTVRLHVAFNG